MADAFLSGSVAQARGGSAVAALLQPPKKPPPAIVTTPSYLTAVGQYALDSQGSMWSIDSTGAVYRDGLRTPGVSATKLAIVGKGVFALTKVSHIWLAWSTTTGWGTTAVLGGDPSILT